MAKKKNEEYSDDDQGYGDEPNFDDPKGYVDDVSDEGACKMKKKNSYSGDGGVQMCQHGLSRPLCT